ncbi:MAG: hypothetical protein ACE5G2_11160, partial [Candidatus Krumholzibacteriia bacterium]
MGYKYDDHVVFNAEIEIEHASTGKRGEVSLEFGYVDLLVDPAVNVRMGLVLVPMGFVNELHEPPTFLGANRPETERRIIPTTWRANGLGIFGKPDEHVAGLSYRAYVIESLASVASGSRTEKFSASGLRGGRQKGSKALVEDVAGVLRADYESHGALIGGSVFFGNTAQGRLVEGDEADEEFDGFTSIFEGHLQVRHRGLSFRALVAAADVDEAEKINRANGFTGTESVGSTLLGWYVEAGYDV